MSGPQAPEFDYYAATKPSGHLHASRVVRPGQDVSEFVATMTIQGLTVTRYDRAGYLALRARPEPVRVQLGAGVAPSAPAPVAAAPLPEPEVEPMTGATWHMPSLLDSVGL